MHRCIVGLERAVEGRSPFVIWGLDHYNRRCRGQSEEQKYAEKIIGIAGRVLWIRWRTSVYQGLYESGAEERRARISASKKLQSHVHLMYITKKCT